MKSPCGPATFLPPAVAHIKLLASSLCAALPQGNKHRQISDRLRDIQNKKKLQKTELDLTNQRIERRQQDINNLQKELEVCVLSIWRFGVICDLCVRSLFAAMYSKYSYCFLNLSLSSGVPEEVVPSDSRAEETDGETEKHGSE